MLSHKLPKTPSLAGKLQQLILSIFIPMLVMTGILLGLFVVRNISWEKRFSNIALASGFNQDFKKSVDLQMYYFATGSEYANGIPLDEVQSALALASDLQASTTNKDSQKAIRSVISLCDTLQEKMIQISQMDSYDERMEQLDSNIYILTELISGYMYNYLYYEAGELGRLQTSMRWMVRIELGLAIIALILIVFFSVQRAITISRSITKPIDELYSRVQSIDEGELAMQEPVKAEDEKLQALSDGFEEMVGHLAEQIELNKEEAKTIRSMELMLLQAQINPHFLYNTLDTIIWLCETGKNNQAVEMVNSLSNYFRVSLSKGRDVISLNEENSHVKSYLEIQQVRYKDILTYELEIDREIGEYILPKLTLQPIVENALYHGIKLKRGMGQIQIRGSFLDDSREKILLTVKDTGIGMNPETLARCKESLEAEHSAGFGMAAVYKRLKLMFGEECAFDVESSEGVGTQVSIIIPAMLLQEKGLGDTIR